MNAKKTTKTAKQQVQIIAGNYRHRKIHFTEIDGLRPTGARIRETLFNWLQPVIEGKTVLDLFAGSGILGFEALSRGAKQVTFVEKNPRAVKQIQANLTALSISQANLIPGDYHQGLNGQYDIVLLDPPYALRLLPVLLKEILPLSPHYVFIEDNQPFADWINTDGEYQILKSKKAGHIYYGLLTINKA
ncbi:MAG: 16S rRNA (guanine(966)-N(2))-methyltransferase RsmD [Gammaproteobacteria bacterium]|nr:MAG: 16S rRNA (guanine(966)-N(2))-methyltransferase RsmD [Gammaproteobacteria bacterium]